MVGAGDLQDQAPGSGGPETGHHHAGCTDFICHGGVAVLAAATAWVVSSWPEARPLPWEQRALHSVSPAGLDRPPKSLVSA
jgi:hypothetical protein